jgi:hypothetical protein
MHAYLLHSSTCRNACALRLLNTATAAAQVSGQLVQTQHYLVCLLISGQNSSLVTASRPSWLLRCHPPVEHARASRTSLSCSLCSRVTDHIQHSGTKAGRAASHARGVDPDPLNNWLCDAHWGAYNAQHTERHSHDSACVIRIRHKHLRQHNAPRTVLHRLVELRHGRVYERPWPKPLRCVTYACIAAHHRGCRTAATCRTAALHTIS